MPGRDFYHINVLRGHFPARYLGRYVAKTAARHMSWLTDIFHRHPKMSAGEAIDFYRSLGFFKSRLDNTALLEEYRREWRGEEYDPSNRFDDVYLLAFDQERVWCGDPECAVADVNKVYVEVLKEWASISDGIFSPKDVVEKWDSDDGPITLAFQHANIEYQLDPEWNYDYLDLNILNDINRIVESSGRHFACFSDVNYAIVFVTNHDQRQQMLDVRNFPFTI